MTPHQHVSRLQATEVLAVSCVNAATQNNVSIQEHQTMPNPALAAVLPTVVFHNRFYAIGSLFD
jgi:hypothetical protein